MGFGQNRRVGLSLATRKPKVEYRSMISMDGRLPAAGTGAGRSKTLVLLYGGSRSRQVTKSAIAEIRERFEDAEDVR